MASNKMGLKIINGICLALVLGLSGYAIADDSFSLPLFIGFCFIAGIIWLCCLPFIAIGGLAKAGTDAINRKKQQD